MRSDAGPDARPRRRPCAVRHAQRAAAPAQHGAPQGLSRNHRHRSGGHTHPAAPAAALVRPRRPGPARAPAARGAAADPLGGQRARHRCRLCAAARPGHRARPRHRRLAPHAAGPAALAHHRARRRPAPVRRCAAHADPVGRHAPGRRHDRCRPGAAGSDAAAPRRRAPDRCTDCHRAGRRGRAHWPGRSAGRPHHRRWPTPGPEPSTPA